MDYKTILLIIAVIIAGFFCINGAPEVKFSENSAPETVNETVERVLEKEDTPTKTEDERPVVLLFYADWCSACRKFSPSFKAVKNRIGANRYRFVEVNVDKHNGLSNHFNIRLIPTVYIYDKKYNYKKKINLSNLENELRQYIENRK